ncbi:MAG: FAD-dependent oxidoreductase, partial [Bacillota bacterium]|nr:FAD-dependent oxidoreductase [Bacillota bacterium]
MAKGNKDQDRVVVVGGGTAGVAAALAAAKNGATVTLIEKNGFLGGVATFGIPFLAFKDGCGRRVVGGIGQKLVERLMELDASPGHVGCAYWAGLGQDQQFHLTPYDPEGYKYAVLQLAAEAGVRLQLHSQFVDVEQRPDGCITAVTFACKDGLERIEADIVIDTSGDADVARRAGCSIRLGGAGRTMQNVSGIFILSDVSAEQAVAALQAGRQIRGWNHWHTRVVTGDLVDGAKGINHFAGLMTPWGDERTYAFTAVAWRKNVYSLNISRTTGINGCLASDLNQAEVNERLQMYELFKAMRAHVPGFEQANLIATSPMVGIRESANIKGAYVLTKDDVLLGRDHEDNIARGCYPIDIHDPAGGHTTFAFIREGGSYGIPYRCLVPDRVANLLVAGRCLSASHEAHGSTRIMATAMATGEAAGTAAALALASGQLPAGSQFDVKA